MHRLLLITALFISCHIIAQQEHPGIHQEELEYYNSLGNATATYYEQIPNESVLSGSKKVCNLEKVVYGWHPYWVGSAYQNYQWDLLSHFSFFSYEVNAADGEPVNTHGWSTSAAVDAALASGNTKVTLCVTLFSGHTTFFGSPTAQQTLINNLINLVQSRGAHGVNIDFEGLPSSQTTNFANFMVSLANQMHSAIPGSEVSTVLYAVDWNNVFDFSIMEPEVDHYVIMGYGYYYSGSSTAGPTDPLYHFGSTYNYTLSKSITYYLDKGCPKNKLVLGLPSYGYEWATSSQTIPSATVGSGTAKTYAVIMNNTSGNYSAGNLNWVADPVADAFVFNDGVNDKQCFISLDSAWRKRLEHVNHTGIAGIGIWALGYDNGYTELWQAMEDYLTDCHEDPCSGIIHDFGGPTKNYYNDEDYTWTIEPPGAASLDISFSAFDVETNWDYLYIYDGNSTAAPQIAGSPFTGTSGPGTFTTSTGAVTFRFTSDGATVTPGFLANYTCNSIPPPVASFSLSGQTVCAGDSIQLINTSSDGESFYWTTSAGTLSSAIDENPYLYPTSTGTYTVTLDVTNFSGTDQVFEQIFITVEAEPLASAVAVDTMITIPGEVAYFTNNSINATSYLWNFGDGQTSTDSNPWHAYSSDGVYTAQLIAENASCGNDTTELTIYVGTLGLTLAGESAILVYPNPASEYLIVELPQHQSGNLVIEDMNGRVVLTSEISSETKISVRDLARGIYMLHFATTKGAYSSKLVVE